MPLICAAVPVAGSEILSIVLLLIVAGDIASIAVKSAELPLVFAAAEMFLMLLLEMVSEAVAAAPSLMPVKLPEDVEEPWRTF